MRLLQRRREIENVYKVVNLADGTWFKATRLQIVNAALQVLQLLILLFPRTFVHEAEGKATITFLNCFVSHIGWKRACSITKYFR